jgi:hypothetical protein
MDKSKNKKNEKKKMLTNEAQTKGNTQTEQEEQLAIKNGTSKKCKKKKER